MQCGAPPEGAHWGGPALHEVEPVLTGPIAVLRVGGVEILPDNQRIELMPQRRALHLLPGGALTHAGPTLNLQRDVREDEALLGRECAAQAFLRVGTVS